MTIIASAQFNNEVAGHKVIVDRTPVQSGPTGPAEDKVFWSVPIAAAHSLTIVGHVSNVIFGFWYNTFKPYRCCKSQ